MNDNDGFFHFYAAKAAYALEKNNIAFQLFDQCVKVDRNNAQVFKYKGLILERMGNSQAARIFLEKAKKMKKRRYIVYRELLYFVPLYEMGG